ncbi:MAG: hypothetical protein Alpg2KO_03490 [Alphaproteobacteria bacterium]
MTDLRILALLGTSRSDGNTRKVLDATVQGMGSSTRIMDLQTLALQPYDYDQNYSDDTFLHLAAEMAESDLILFATPVYWYAMSAQMKVLFDRLSDLLGTHKALGRALAGRKTAMIATGTDADLPDGFEVPFQRTSTYFDMDYLGALYMPEGKSAESEAVRADRIRQFQSLLTADYQD